jgi:hypothetical protein
MIRKKGIAAIVFLITASIAGILIYSNRQGYSAHVFISGNGWGYNIQKGRKTIIHQPYIPCIAGNVSFENKTTAQKTGDLVVEKLIKKQSPRISKVELEAVLNIKINN